MLKLIAGVKKELLILVRDKASLAILFLMPMVLVFIITLIQDTTFKTLNNTRLSVVFVDLDKDSLGTAIRQGLEKSGYFQLVTSIAGKPVNSSDANRLVAEGNYQLGVVVPANATASIKTNATRLTDRMLSEDSGKTIPRKQFAKILLYFDPATKNTFKNSIVSSLEKFISDIELKIFIETFTENMKEVMPGFRAGDVSDIKSIELQETYATSDVNKIIPNSVQHNVPAWTMFAMFFIVIPLAGNIIREKDYGTRLRLRTMPVSFLTIFTGKLLTYLFVCILQFLLMMLVGILFLPMLGLPALNMGSSVAGLSVIVLSSALAATGYGVLIGSVSTTREQAASFGSISVMILAAIGGIWVPVFAMPPAMRTLSGFSPLNWGLTGFYNIFLRNGNLYTIFPDALKLLLFFAVSMGIAYYFNKFKDRQN